MAERECCVSFKEVKQSTVVCGTLLKYALMLINDNVVICLNIMDKIILDNLI